MNIVCDVCMKPADRGCPKCLCCGLCCNCARREREDLDDYGIDEDRDEDDE